MLPRLIRIKREHRPDESDADLGQLYSAISDAYLVEPIDIPAFCDSTKIVRIIRPGFAPGASPVARIHTLHVQRDAAYLV